MSTVIKTTEKELRDIAKRLAECVKPAAKEVKLWRTSVIWTLPDFVSESPGPVWCSVTEYWPRFIRFRNDISINIPARMRPWKQPSGVTWLCQLPKSDKVTCPE